MTSSLFKAADALVKKLDECIPHIDNTFALQQIRSGTQFTGPSFGLELEALRREVLQGDPASASEP